MCENRESIMNACKALIEGLDSNRQTEVSAQLFLEYCVYGHLPLNISVKRLTDSDFWIGPKLKKCLKYNPKEKYSVHS